MARPFIQLGALAPRRTLLLEGSARDAVVLCRLPGARRAASSMPTLLQLSFWKSMVPKPFRKSSETSATKITKSKDWNPATFFIVIFLFIGSMSIQQIALKKSFETFTRQSDVRIELLREVIEKLQKGEKVDVERVLGTGDAQKEVEWQQVIEEIEREDAARNQKKKQAERSPPMKPKDNEPVRMEEIPQAVEQPARPSRATFF